MSKPKKALVVVLGELARSPRMQYHCLSLASNQFEVTVIGYAAATTNSQAISNSSQSGVNNRDKACCRALEEHPNIQQKHIKEPPEFKRFLPSFLAYVVKTIWQSITLFGCILMTARPDIILVQNPPSIPTLPVVWFYRLFARSKLIIDWHNYGYSILSLAFKSERHLLVRLARWTERIFGRRAHMGFTVTEAMKEDLKQNWNIEYPLNVLYDRSPTMFRPLSLNEKHDFYIRMKAQYRVFEEDLCPRMPHEDCSDDSRFTTLDPIRNVITYQRNRPALIMSSTSWTEDEDFSLLLEALKMYDVALNGPKNHNIIVPIPESDDSNTSDAGTTVTDDLVVKVEDLPDIVCVITGKGPLKEYYKNKIKEIGFSSKIEILLPWLSSSDYATMVGSCDFGLSLHYSSSGLDLPMKVVDMFGCAVPVLAYDYECLKELVVNDLNGLTFVCSKELFERMVYLLHDFNSTNSYMFSDEWSIPRSRVTKLQQYRAHLMEKFVPSKWERNWDEKAKVHIMNELL